MSKERDIMFEKGDVIRVSVIRKPGFGPNHYGVYDGNDGVYHFAGENIRDVYVKYSSLDDFEDGGRVVVDSYPGKKYSPEQIIQRAQSKLGSDFGGYNLYSNNCEHFAFWCVTGIRRSLQSGHTNSSEDDRDIGEKVIDMTFEPLIKLGDRIDKIFGWGDYKR